MDLKEFCFSKKRVLAVVLFLTPLFAGDYTVKKRDTLWDISGKYLGDPYSWEELWEHNPQINNPHRIYPGDKIVISGISSTNTVNHGRNNGEYSASANYTTSVSDENSVSTTGLKYRKEPILREVFRLKQPKDQDFSSENETKFRRMVASGKFTQELRRQSPFLWEIANSSNKVIPGNSYILANKNGKTLFKRFDLVKCAVENGTTFSVGDTLDLIHVVKNVTFQNKKMPLVTRVGFAVVDEVFNESNGLSSMKVMIISAWGMVNAKDRVVKKADFTANYLIKDFVEPTNKVEATIKFKADISALSFMYEPFIIDKGKIDGIKLGDIFKISALDDDGRVLKKSIGRAFVINVGSTTSTILVAAMNKSIKCKNKAVLFKSVVLPI